MSDTDAKTPQQDGANDQILQQDDANDQAGLEGNEEQQTAQVAASDSSSEDAISSSPTEHEGAMGAVKTPPDEPRPAQNPTRRLALIVGICVVVLALSIWGLVSAFGASDEPEPGNQVQMSSGSSATSASSGTASSGSADEPDASVDESADTGEQTTTTTEATSSSPGSSSTTGQGSATGNTDNNQPAPEQSQAINVILSVDCSEAVAIGNATAIAVSDNGAMRYATLRLNAGATVYDALVACGAAIGSNSGSMGVYITSIDGLAEKEAGGSSGWKYFINGADPGRSCNLQTLSDGDRIEWRYVLQA